jgi:predicted dehydrogenase
VDIVLVATPNNLHRDLSIAAMRAGKHVLCEKPVTPTSAELEDILAVAKETGKVFYPRQNRRWDEDYLIIKKIYDENLLGKTFNIESCVHGSRGIPGDWRGVKEYGGGMMLDWGVHLLDRLLMMIPEKITKVFCSLTNITNDEVDDGFKMHLTFESGLTAVVEVGTCHFISLPLWFIAANHGTASISNWSCSGEMVRLNSWDDKDAKPILAGEGLTKTMAPRLGKSIEKLPLPEVDYDRNELYSNLADAVNGEAEQIVTAEQALRVFKLMEAAFKSSKEGVVVYFE